MLVVHLFLWCLMHHCILFYVLFQSDIVRLQEQWLSAIDMRVHANGSLIAETDIGQTAFDTQCPGTKWPCQCRPTALSFKSIHILYTKTKLSLWTPDFAVDSLSVNDIQYAYIYIYVNVYIIYCILSAPSVLTLLPSLHLRFFHSRRFDSCPMVRFLPAKFSDQTMPGKFEKSKICSSYG